MMMDKNPLGTPKKVGGGPNPAKNVNTSNWGSRVDRVKKGGCGHANCNGSCGC